jgi:CRP/FNR family transcriptional regulator
MRASRTLFPLRFSFYPHLSQDGRERLTRIRVARVGAREKLLAPGQDAGGAVFVTTGRLRVYYLTETGREATLYHVGAGQACVLSLAMTFENAPFPAWAEAGPLGASLVRLPGSDVSSLLETEPAFRAFVFSSLAGRILDLMKRLEELGTARVEARLARLLLDASGPLSTPVTMTQVAMASDLGTAREVVFRTLRSLANRQLISTGRRRVHILNRSGLAQVAGSAIKPR